MKTYTLKIVALIARKTNKQPMCNTIKIQADDPLHAMEKARKNYHQGAYNVYLIGEK